MSFARGRATSGGRRRLGGKTAFNSQHVARGGTPITHFALALRRICQKGYDDDENQDCWRTTRLSRSRAQAAKRYWRQHIQCDTVPSGIFRFETEKRRVELPGVSAYVSSRPDFNITPLSPLSTVGKFCENSKRPAACWAQFYF